MITNRCEYINENARTQCGQEAFAIFEGSRQKLCKLHTTYSLNQLDSQLALDLISPIKVINEGDQEYLDTVLESVNRRFHFDEEESTEDEGRTDSEQNSTKEQENSRADVQGKGNNQETDINRSDKDTNHGDTNG